MRNVNLEPENPYTTLEQLQAEREAILTRIQSPLGRLAARAVAPFGHGPLAVNTWHTSYVKKKTIR